MTRQKDCFTGRDRTRLQRARENGYLDASCRSASALRDAYSFWCWRLHLPVVWFERLTPRSKFGRLHLDMFTTQNILSKEAEAELSRLGRQWPQQTLPRSSSHDATWDRVPIRYVEESAKAALRIALRAERMPPAEVSSAKVLPWKIPA